MAAGVHHPWPRGLVRLVALLLHRQRVHVRAEHDRPAGAAASNDADDAGPADAGPGLDAERSEALGDISSRLVLLEPELWMGVQVTAVTYQLVADGDDRCS